MIGNNTLNSVSGNDICDLLNTDLQLSLLYEQQKQFSTGQEVFSKLTNTNTLNQNKYNSRICQSEAVKLATHYPIYCQALSDDCNSFYRAVGLICFQRILLSQQAEFLLKNTINDLFSRYINLEQIDYSTKDQKKQVFQTSIQAIRKKLHLYLIHCLKMMYQEIIKQNKLQDAAFILDQLIGLANSQSAFDFAMAAFARALTIEALKNTDDLKQIVQDELNAVSRCGDQTSKIPDGVVQALSRKLNSQIIIKSLNKNNKQSQVETVDQPQLRLIQQNDVICLLETSLDSNKPIYSICFDWTDVACHYSVKATTLLENSQILQLCQYQQQLLNQTIKQQQQSQKMQTSPKSTPDKYRQILDSAEEVTLNNKVMKLNQQLIEKNIAIMKLKQRLYGTMFNKIQFKSSRLSLIQNFQQEKMSLQKTINEQDLHIKKLEQYIAVIDSQFSESSIRVKILEEEMSSNVKMLDREDQMINLVNENEFLRNQIHKIAVDYEEKLMLTAQCQRCSRLINLNVTPSITIAHYKEKLMQMWQMQLSQTVPFQLKSQLQNQQYKNLQIQSPPTSGKKQTEKGIDKKSNGQSNGQSDEELQTECSKTKHQFNKKKNIFHIINNKFYELRII